LYCNLASDVHSPNYPTVPAYNASPDRSRFPTPPPANTSPKPCVLRHVTHALVGAFIQYRQAVGSPAGSSAGFLRWPQ
jgi:hypothetical protein